MTALRTERTAPPLRIGGLTPLSTTDWPGQLAAVVFCQGCPWRCGYCHNPHLLPARGAVEIAWDDVLALLRRRRGLLDGVVFSGGEPLAQTGLGNAVRAVKGLGFRVGLHTAGAYPQRLCEMLPLVDWVAFDIKARIADYESVTSVAGSGEQALESARLVIASGVAHEFRTTVHPRLHEPQGIARLAGQLADFGVRHYALQEFRAEGCASSTLAEDVPPSFLSESYGAAIAGHFTSFQLRRAV